MLKADVKGCWIQFGQLSSKIVKIPEFNLPNCHQYLIFRNDFRHQHKSSPINATKIDVIHANLRFFTGHLLVEWIKIRIDIFILQDHFCF